MPRGWLSPPRETPVARLDAVFYKLPSRLYSFRVHRRRSVCQVFEIFRKVRRELYSTLMPTTEVCLPRGTIGGSVAVLW